MEKILLFIPMYNCERQIVRVLQQLTEEVCGYLSEVIIVNNRSTDNGEQVVVDCLSSNTLPVKVRLLRNDENYGLGGSHKVAFHYAVQNGFDYVIVLHGDDQANIHDFLPVLRTHAYRKADCVLGSRFMKGSRLEGYSPLRIFGNFGFNFLFSAVARRKITDLGSGLNMYRVEPLRSDFFHKYPDTLYFNDLMLLAYTYYGFSMKFYPITWREEDQISNNKIISFSKSLLKMLSAYSFRRKEFMNSDMREKKYAHYGCQVIWENGAEI